MFDKQVRKALVGVILERVLLEMGRPVYDEVVRVLYDNYNCNLPDCYENPMYLKQVLQDLYGRSYGTIIESLKKQLKEYETQKGINDFIISMSV